MAMQSFVKICRIVRFQGDAQLLCEKSRLLEGGFSSVGHLDPLPVRRGLGVVVVVPVPPLVWRGLGVTVWRVLPSLLAAERRDVEVAPGGPHRLVAAAVDEVCAEDPLAVAAEHVVAVPFIG